MAYFKIKEVNRKNSDCFKYNKNQLKMLWEKATLIINSNINCQMITLNLKIKKEEMYFIIKLFVSLLKQSLEIYFWNCRTNIFLDKLNYKKYFTEIPSRFHKIVPQTLKQSSADTTKSYPKNTIILRTMYLYKQKAMSSQVQV